MSAVICAGSETFPCSILRPFRQRSEGHHTRNQSGIKKWEWIHRTQTLSVSPWTRILPRRQRHLIGLGPVSMVMESALFCESVFGHHELWACWCYVQYRNAHTCGCDYTHTDSAGISCVWKLDVWPMACLGLASKCNWLESTLWWDLILLKSHRVVCS